MYKNFENIAVVHKSMYMYAFEKVSNIWRPYFIRMDNPAKLHAHAYANNIRKCVNPEHVHNTSTMQFQALINSGLKILRLQKILS